MRFSTKQLLLLLTAWIIAFRAAQLLESTKLVTWIHSRAISQIHLIQCSIEFQVADNPMIPISAIEQFSEPEIDPWGNAYRLKELSRGGISKFCAFSCGADGISKSNGDDSDDINSWNDHSHQHYQELVRFRESKSSFWQSLWLTPITYLILIFSIWVLRGIVRSRWITMC